MSYKFTESIVEEAALAWLDALGYSVVKPVFDKILANEEQISTLAALRGTLLPKLISGELRIKDAEQFVGEIV